MELEIAQMTRLFGMDDEFGEDAILGRLESMKDVIERVNRQFKDPVRYQNHKFLYYAKIFVFIEAEKLLLKSLLRFSRFCLLPEYCWDLFLAINNAFGSVLVFEYQTSSLVLLVKLWD